jgi:ADP-ribose pyrophosphatase YjhB (NUDIX family)
MQYKHCPNCGKAYENSQKKSHPECHNCGHIFWQNSKPTASVLILNEKPQVLLGKRAKNPGKGKWDIIGGFLELGEHPEVGAAREAKEEAGAEITITGMVGIFMDNYELDDYATLNVCYTAKLTGGELKPGDDIAELKWFDVEALPEDIAFQNGQDMLDAWIKQIAKKEV